MDKLLVNAGPIAHMAGEGPIVGKIEDETAYVPPRWISDINIRF